MGEVLRKIVEKRINKTMTTRSCAYEFSVDAFRCHSVVLNTDKKDLLPMVDALCNELIASVNVLEHPPDMINSYVSSCIYSFNAGWSKRSDLDIFFIRRSKMQIAFTRMSNGLKSTLAIFLQDDNLNSVFIDLNDTLATDRVWFLVNKFPKK